MCIQISEFTIPRPHKFRKTSFIQSMYKLQPWGQSSDELPIILMRNKKSRNSLISNSKEKIKISAFYSNEKSKEKQREPVIIRDSSINSFSHGRKKMSKYDSNIYRTKTIRNFDLMQEERYNKSKMKKNFSKKLLVKKDKGLPEISPSSFSTHQEHANHAKVEKRLQLERKIFMMMSRDRL